MKKISTCSLLIFAASAIACSSNPAPKPGVTGIKLTPSSTGFFDGTNGAGILGAWYSYGDWYNPVAGMGDCAVKGGYTADQCSSITTPTPGMPFMADPTKGMCTTGTAAKVIDSAYSAIWGAGIGFDLNNQGTDDGGTGVKGAWDATGATGTAHMPITGFAFDIDSVPIGGQMRVEFPTNAVTGTTDINGAYWGGATMNLSPFTMPGTYSFKFADMPAGTGVGGPMYEANAPAFDDTKILSVQFHVVTNTSSTIPYMFCINNLTALTN